MTRTKDDSDLFAELGAVGPLSAYARDLLREEGISERCVARIAARYEQQQVVVHSRAEMNEQIRRRYRELRHGGARVEEARETLYAEGYDPEAVDRVIEKGLRKNTRKSGGRIRNDFA